MRDLKVKERYMPTHRDGSPVMLHGKPVVVVPLREVFPCWFDADGNPKEFPDTRKPIQHVYAIREGTSKNIKIGISHDVATRLSDLQSGTTTLLSIVYVWKIENASKIEHLLHKKFAHLNIHREWFQLNKAALCELRAYMQSLGAKLEIFEEPARA